MFHFFCSKINSTLNCKYIINGHSSLQNGSDEDFELMNDMPKEDPIIIEHRRIRNNEITKKTWSLFT